MKNLLIILTVLIFIFSCEKKSKKVIKDKNLDFLLGNWKRIDNQPGTFTFESWKKVKENVYYGVGYTLKDSDTISKEIMEIEKLNNQWNLKVTFGKDLPVNFYIEKYSNQHFIAENPENDFPKLINYSFKRDTIFAYIQADSIKVPFTFVK
jgi:hypothetical protein